MGAFKRHDWRALSTFLVFDVFDRKGYLYLPDDERQPLLEKAGLFPWSVKVLAMLGHPTMEDMLEAAKSNDFLLEGLGLVGEGAVLKAPDWRNECGCQTYGKPVFGEFKKERRRPKERREETDIEQRIAEPWLSDAELEKNIAKGCVRCSAERFNQSSRRMAVMLLSLCRQTPAGRGAVPSRYGWAITMVDDHFLVNMSDWAAWKRRDAFSAGPLEMRAGYAKSIRGIYRQPLALHPACCGQ